MPCPYHQSPKPAHRPIRSARALAYLRFNERMVNRDYRRLNHCDMLTAGRDLRGLVQTGLVHQRGVGRGTFYELAVPRGLPTDPGAVLSMEERVLAFVREYGSIDNTRCRAALGVDFQQAKRLLTRMVRDGLLRREGTGRWSTYRLV